MVKMGKMYFTKEDIQNGKEEHEKVITTIAH
jgi:hypothetical protein